MLLVFGLGCGIRRQQQLFRVNTLQLRCRGPFCCCCDSPELEFRHSGGHFGVPSKGSLKGSLRDL